MAYLRYVHDRTLHGVIPVLDTETETMEGAPDPDEINGLYALPLWLAVTLPDELGDRVAIPLRSEEVIEEVRVLLEDEGVTSCWHNAGYDYPALQNLGITIRGGIVDTLEWDVLLFPETRNNRHSIDDICEDFFGIRLPKYKELYSNPNVLPPGHSKPTGKIRDYPDHVAADYACSDTWRGALVLNHHRKLMEDTDLYDASYGPLTTYWDYYWTVEEPHSRALLKMARRGTQIDRSFLEELSRRMEAEEQSCLAKVFRLLGQEINVNSTAQMAHLLFEDFGLTPTRKTGGGAWSVDGESIEDCLTELRAMAASRTITEDDPRLESLTLIVRAKDTGKSRSTFVDGILERLDPADFIQTSYGLARTGRIRSYRPNLTNLPNVSFDEWGIRRAWIPSTNGEEDMLVADYSQLELRILAAFSQDEHMLADIHAGRDLHSASTARSLGIPYEEFEARKKAGDEVAIATRVAMKTCKFADIYGATAVTMARQLSKALKRYVSEEEAAAFQLATRETSPTATQWLAELKAWAAESGFVTTLLGRKRELPGIKSKVSHIRERNERVAGNTPIQGGAADIVKMALLTCDTDSILQRLGWILRMQIHDELVLTGPKRTGPEALERVVYLMEHPFETLGLNPPIPLHVEAKLCSCWADGK